jgi:acyl dehydratase
VTIDPAVVGRSLGTLVREVSWRDTTAYAAATGDANPAYLDDTREGGLVAPPPFAVALTWPLLSSIGERLGDALPPDVLATLVHAGERLVFHRPVRPGESVELAGRVVSLRPGRGGARIVFRVDASSGGEARFTEHVTVLFRGVECAGAGAAIEDVPEPPAAAASDVPARWEAPMPIRREAPFVYDACTGIVFPIHTSVAFARAVGLPDILVQGTCVLARACREVVDRECGGDPVALRSVECRFTGMVVPPATLSARATGAGPGADGVTVIGIDVRDEGGRTVLAGCARVGPPLA